MGWWYGCTAAPLVQKGPGRPLGLWDVNCDAGCLCEGTGWDPRGSLGQDSPGKGQEKGRVGPVGCFLYKLRLVLIRPDGSSGRARGRGTSRSRGPGAPRRVQPVATWTERVYGDTQPRDWTQCSARRRVGSMWADGSAHYRPHIHPTGSSCWGQTTLQGSRSLDQFF